MKQKSKFPKLTRLESLMAGFGISRMALAKNIGRSYGIVSRYICGSKDVSLQDARLIVKYINEVSKKDFSLFDVFEKEVG